jgi:hypothetical protein
VPEEADEAGVAAAAKGKGKQEDVKSPTSEKHTRNGTMDRNFKFPPGGLPKDSAPPPPVPPLPDSLSNAKPTDTIVESESDDEDEGDDEEEEDAKDIKSPQSSVAPIEVPPPDPIEKEKERVDPGEPEGDDDIGATEEISLN